MERKYKADDLTFKELGDVSKPKIQRGFRWTQRKQNELINTIREGLPFGTFLLEEKKKGKSKYSILDGQQRYTTMKNYKEDLTPFISNDDINVDRLINIVHDNNDLRKAIKGKESKFNKVNYKKIIKKHKTDKKSMIREMEQELLKQIDNEELSEVEKLHSLEDCIEVWLDEVLKPIDIDNVRVPVIILTDKIDDKADVFIKLNQGGVKLTKYELLAAMWNSSNSELCCDDKEILEQVVNKYKNTANKEIEYDEVDENKIYDYESGKNINAYEYLYGLSKIIDKNIETTLGKKKTDESAYGFIIVSEIFNIASKDMIGVDKKLSKFKDLRKLKEKIVDSTVAVYKRLKNEFKAPDGSVYLDHTENQIVSFIVAYFKTKYKIDNNRIVDKKTAGDKRNNENLMDYMIQHYIYDNITDEWVGSGDKKLHEMVKDENLNNCRYFQSINKDNFSFQLEKWFENKNSDDSKSVKPDTKMLLSFVLNKTSKGLNKDIEDKLQWEHIGIKSKLLENTPKIKVGISSPSNLTLIPTFDNIHKQKLTYYEFEKDSKNKSLFKLKKDCLPKLLYPCHDDIKWVEGTKSISKEEFESFKEKRTSLILGYVLDYLFNEK